MGEGPAPPLIPVVASSTPYSLLPRLLPSRPELELALVWTSNKLLVELNLFANSVKESRLTLVLLLLFSFGSVAAFKLLLLLPLLPLSLRLGIVVVEIEREGRAREFGLLFLWCEGVVPVRGRRPPLLEWP